MNSERLVRILQTIRARIVAVLPLRRVVYAGLLCLFLAIPAVYAAYLYLPVGRGENVIITIPPGSSASIISGQLEAQGVVRSGEAFALLARVKGLASQLQAGSYDFSPHATLGEVLDKIVAGDVIDQSVRVTIPEGLTLSGMGLLFERRGLFSQAEFLAAADSIELPYEYLAAVPPGVTVASRVTCFPTLIAFP